MFDAYTIKKIAPRILIGVIMINLSIYMVTLAADLTRVVANGAATIVTAPLGQDYNFTINTGGGAGGQVEKIAIDGLLAFALFKGAQKARDSSGTVITHTKRLGTITKGIFSSKSNTGAKAAGASATGDEGTALQSMLFAVIIPIGLLALSVLVTLVFRQGLLIFLAVISPIAWALYMLPSTEKYFKKWLDFYLRALMVYPIIVLVFAVSDVLASIIFNNNHSIPGVITGLIAMFAPFGLIPFSFKLAGGALGSIHGMISSTASKAREHGWYKGQKEKARHHREVQRTQHHMNLRREATERLRDDPNLTGRQRRRLTSVVSRNQKYLEREAALNKAAVERTQLITGFGDDTEQRAGLATYRTLTDKDGNPITDKDGKQKTGWFDMTGKEYTQAEVMAARRANGSDQFKFQQNLAYQYNKASTEAEHDSIVGQYIPVRESLGMERTSFGSAMIGAGFQMKTKSIQWKNTVDKEDAEGEFIRLNGGTMTKEQHAVMGTYASLAQDADNFRTLGMVVEKARNDTRLTQPQRDALFKQFDDISKTMESQFAAGGGAQATIQAAYNQGIQQYTQQQQALLAQGNLAGAQAAGQAAATMATPGASADAAKAIEDFMLATKYKHVDDSQIPTLTLPRRKVIDASGNTVDEDQATWDARNIKLRQDLIRVRKDANDKFQKRNEFQRYEVDVLS